MAEKIICIIGLSILAVMALPFILGIGKYIGAAFIEGFLQFCKVWLAAWRCVFKGIQTDGKEGADK